jgi:hypothetical protein
MSVLSNGKLYEGNERPPYGQPDILLGKFRCEHCDKFFTDLDLHYEEGCEGIGVSPRSGRGRHEVHG